MREILDKNNKKDNERGLKFSVSFLFYVYVLFFVLTGRIVEFLSYLIALISHEFAHAYVANKRGYELNEMKIGVFGAQLCGKFETVKREDEIAIAVAGPLCNVLSVFITVALWWLLPSFYPITCEFVNASFALFLFNLLPVYPLDGGRVIIALLTKKTDRESAYKKLRKFGFILATVLFSLFVALIFYSSFNPSFLLVGIFVLVSTLVPDKTCAYRKLFLISYRSERIKKGLPIREIAVYKSTKAIDCEKMLNGEYYTIFIVMDEDLTPCASVFESSFDSVCLDDNLSISSFAKICENNSKND